MPIKDRANSGRYSPAKGSNCSAVGFELDKTIPAQPQDPENQAKVVGYKTTTTNSPEPLTTDAQNTTETPV